MSKSGAYSEEKAKYRVRLEKSMILTLITCIALFCLSRRIPTRPKKIIKLAKYITVTPDMTPVTRTGGIPIPPSYPEVPIPSEDEFMTADETIEYTDLDLSEDLPWYDGEYGHPGAQFEEPPESKFEDDRLQAVSGEVRLAVLVNEFGQVDSVRVILNTTRSKSFEEEAIFNAYRTRYKLQKHEAQWIERPFYFKVEM
jgi:TonB family protein